MPPAQVYLDANATTPPWPAVRTAMLAALDGPGNPSSVHASGRAARAAVEQARAVVADATGARPRDLVFTSGGTEANALALAHAGDLPVFTSAIEHESVLAQAPAAVRVPVLPDGTLDLQALEQLIGGRAVFLSVMAANNETGVLQPVREAAALVHAHGGLVHCDAVQALGKVPLSMADLDVDFLTVSAHKIGGPTGIGALAISCGAAAQPLMRGGGQEQGWRAGTENVAGIAGFAAACEAIAAHSWQPGAEHLRDQIEAAVPPECAVVPRSAPRLPNTTCLWMPGVAAATQVMMFDLEGIAVSAGAACSSGKVRPSHVLRAMGLPEDVAAQTIRISLGWQSSAADVAQFARAWHKLAARTRRTAA